MTLVSLALQLRIFRFALALVSAIGLFSLASQASAQTPAGTGARTISVAGQTLGDGDEVFLDIDGFQWTVGVLDNNEALVAISGASDGANARLTIEVVDVAARKIRLKHRGRYIGRVSYWQAFPDRRLSYYAVGSATPNGYGDFVVDASSGQKITLKESGAWISRFCCVPGTSATNAIVASFHGQQGGTGAAIGVRRAGAASAAATTTTTTTLFADGTRINLIADNGLRMNRCNGCQTSVGNTTQNTVVLTDSAETETSTFKISTVTATGKVLLQADNGGYMAYCNGCIANSVVPEFITVAAVAPTDHWSQFELKKLPNGKYTLLAPNGKYVSRCQDCSPSFKERTGVKDGNVVTAHISDPNSQYVQWSITQTGASFRPGKTLDQYAWLTSHNAHVNYSDARWAAPNQSFGIIGQLDRGVRGLMLDTFDFGGSHEVACAVSFGADCYPKGVYLCHGGESIACSGGAGSNYALPRQNFKETMDSIGDWLDKNTRLTDVVTIFLEDYTKAGTVAEAIRTSKANRHLFNPTGSGWTVMNKGWPTLEYLSQVNRRLLIFTSKAGNKNETLGLVWDKEYTVANYWSIGVLGNDVDCRTRWDDVPMNKQETNFKRLVVMSHFRDVPSTGTSYDDNRVTLPTKVNNCIAAVGRYPNYVALDFVEIGNGAAIVEKINTALRK